MEIYIKIKINPLINQCCFLSVLILILSFNVNNAFGNTIDIFPGDSFETAVEGLQPGDVLVVHQGTYSESGRISMHHITARRNHIYHTGINGNTGEGMYIGCNNASCAVSDSIIENNWIHDNLPGTGQGDGIEVKVGSHSNIIKDNVIYNMSFPGIFVYGTEGNPRNIVEGNVIWNCLEGIFAVADAVVRNNIIFKSGTGLSLYSHNQVSQLKNVTSVNNTIYDCDDGIYVRWGGTNMTLANNAVYCPGKTAVNSSMA